MLWAYLMNGPNAAASIAPTLILHSLDVSICQHANFRVIRQATDWCDISIS